MSTALRTNKCGLGMISLNLPNRSTSISFCCTSFDGRRRTDECGQTADRLRNSQYSDGAAGRVHRPRGLTAAGHDVQQTDLQ
jgi:hypothetical protein